MRAKPYSTYKPSGVAWLGDVPAHWEVKRLKYSARLRYGDALAFDEREEGDVPVFGSNGQVGTHSAANTRAPVIAVGRKGSFGKLNFSPVPIFAIDTTFFLDPTSTGADMRWIYFVLGCLGLDSFSNDSAVPGLAREDAYANSLAVPSLPEQRAIAAFLDRETGRIDTLVAKKRELIERLQEKRTALISHAVTRGLDPKAKLKPSGLPCLGDIPAHWDAKPLRFLMRRLDQGWSPTANNYPAAENEYGVLKLSAVNRGHFYPTENKALEELPTGASPITPSNGDVLLSRANTPELVGDCCVVTSAFPFLIIPDLLYRIQFRSAADPEYYCWLFLSRAGRALAEMDARGSSSSMVKIGQGHVRAWKLPVPPLSEQKAIAAFVREATTRLDALVRKAEEAIDRLQEYRTALITAAVTGKIDVRSTSSPRPI